MTLEINSLNFSKLIEIIFYIVVLFMESFLTFENFGIFNMNSTLLVSLGSIKLKAANF